jgi:hypothetical protein
MRAPSAVVAVLALAACSHDTGPPHLLRFSFQPGRSQYYRDTVETETRVAGVPGVGMESTMTSETIQEERVVDVENGVARIEHVIHRMAMHSTGPGSIDYDSDDPASDPGPLAATAELIGKVTRYRIDDRGRVNDCVLPEGFDASALPFGGDPQRWMTGMSSLGELPAEPVAVGATWEHSAPMSIWGLGECVILTTYRLLEVAQGRATLAVAMRMDTGELRMPGGAQMQQESEGGTMVVDLATGRTMESTMNMVTSTSMGAMTTTTTMHMRSQAIDPPAKRGAGK